MSRFLLPHNLRYILLFLSTLFFLTACSILGAGSPDSTPTPQPTSSIADMQVVSSQACKVAEQGMIRVNEPQGDLIAWSPDSDTLAYIASTTDSTWNVGELNILDAPLFNKPTRLATGVAGELTWSPDASMIAYLGLRRSDNLYTVGLAFPNGRSSQDLFPDTAARTDNYSSQKAIMEWIDNSHLSVLTSCGVDCMQPVEFDVQTGYSTPAGVSIPREWGTWSPRTSQPISLPADFADLPGQQNWSPDEKRVAYIDQVGNAWVINANDGTLYPLEIGQYGVATETDWSYDNQYLAVQVDQNLMIFSFKCP